MILVRSFPVKSTKDFFMLLGVTFFIGIYLLFRMLRPERLINVSNFYGILDYFRMMKAPTSPFMPTTWATEVLRPYMEQGYHDSWFYLLLLFSTALATFFKSPYSFPKSPKLNCCAWSLKACSGSL